MRRAAVSTVEQTARMVPIHIAVELENREEVGSLQAGARVHVVQKNCGRHWREKVARWA
jgi:hypothetical protein